MQHCWKHCNTHPLSQIIFLILAFLFKNKKYWCYVKTVCYISFSGKPTKTFESPWSTPLNISKSYWSYIHFHLRSLHRCRRMLLHDLHSEFHKHCFATTNVIFEDRHPPTQFPATMVVSFEGVKQIWYYTHCFQQDLPFVQTAVNRIIGAL